MLASVLSNAGKVAALVILTLVWYHAGTMNGSGWEDAWSWIAWTATGAYALYVVLDTWLEERDVVRLGKVVRNRDKYIARLEREIEGYQKGDIIVLERERDIRRDDTEEEGYGAS
jgi:hypothetical protein